MEKDHLEHPEFREKHKSKEHTRCHVTLNPVVFNNLMRHFQHFHELFSTKYNQPPINVSFNRFFALRVSNAEIIEVRVKKFGTKNLLFIMDLRLGLKVYNLDLILDDLLHPTDQKLWFTNQMKSDRYLTSFFDLASNTIYRWDLYFYYQKRLSESSVVTRRYLERTYNLRFIDNTMYSILRTIATRMDGDSLSRAGVPHNERGRTQVTIKPDEVETEFNVPKEKEVKRQDQ